MSEPSPEKRSRKVAKTAVSKERNEAKKKRGNNAVGFEEIQRYSNLTLPDGTHRRKLEKIKKTLIHKAKVHKTFKKVQGHERQEIEAGKRRFLDLLEEAKREKEQKEQANGRKEDGKQQKAKILKSTGKNASELHPEREAIINQERRSAPSPNDAESKSGTSKIQHRMQRPSRYAKEESEYEKVRREKEQHEREFAERKAAIKKREQERKRRNALVNAKTLTGQRKLGNQSILLLDKVKCQFSLS